MKTSSHSSRAPFALGTFALGILALGALAACDGGGDIGHARFALSTDAPFFRLRIYKTVPADVGAKNLFDTGCLQQQSRTYELSNIPVGDGYTVVYEGFPTVSCDESQFTSLGYRGGVSIAKDGDAPYYHVQIYPRGGVATLPEDINLSASVARAVDFCDGNEDCNSAEVCYDAAKPDYWCVPSCTTDADCRGIHLRASCDVDAGWCTLKNPFPLNLSEPRAFGAAGTLSDGDVLFIGGFRQDGVGNLLPTMYPLERFDAATGLFTATTVSGTPPAIGGQFGFAQLGPDRFVTVGGFVRAGLEWTAQGLDLTNESSDVSADVTVWDASAGTAKAAVLSRSVARSAVVRLAADRFFIAGGLVVSGPGVETTRSTWLCTISEGAPDCQPGPSLQVPRQAPATACLDASCNRVLILGGNPGGALAEVVDLEAQTTTTLPATGLGDKLFAPVLCGLDLVGGSNELARATPFKPAHLTVSADGINATPLDGAPLTSYLAAMSGLDVAFGAAPECYLAGGLEGTSTLQAAGTGIAHADGGSLASLNPTLGRGRFGGVAAKVGSGLLAGRVMFAGGVAIDGDGPVKVVRGAEVLTP